MRPLILLAATLFAFPAYAQTPAPQYDTAPIYQPPVEQQVVGAERRYEICIATALSDAVRAQSEAESWRDAGGGVLARHCRAMAMAAQGLFMEAAQAVEALAADASGDPKAYVDLLAQAGDFRLDAGDAPGARRQFENALATEPDSLAALDGRARAAAGMGDYAAAITDLNRLLWLRPGEVDALSLRAAARRLSGDRTGALGDAEQAVASDPSSPIALFERGAARAQTGDLAGAEADWSQASALDAGGEIGRLATINLARLRGQ